MRFHYYRFPEETKEETLLKEGCGVILKNGEEIYPDSIPEEHRNEVDHIDTTLSGLSVTHAKQLMKKYGGCAWTEHCERDGSVFEVTEILPSQNNSRFNYNHHL